MNQPIPPSPDSPQEDESKSRETTRRISKIVLQSTERRNGKIPMHDKLRQETRDLIAKTMDEKPIFYREDKNSPQVLDVELAIQQQLPQAFFQNPTQWIEAQPNISRGADDASLPKGNTIQELKNIPYDISKVKIVDLGESKVVIKRLDPKHPHEVERAQKAYTNGIPTPKILGTIQDQGNNYALFEHIDGKNLNSYILPLDRIASNSKAYQYSFDSYRKFSSKSDFDYWILLSKKAKIRLKKLWNAALPKIYVQAVCRTLRKRGLDKNEYIETIQEHLDINNYAPEEVQRVLLFFGYDSLEKLAEGIGISENYEDIDEEKITHSFQEMEKLVRDNTDDDLKAFSDQWRDNVEEDIFGCPVTQERERILKLCAEKDIEHKDYNSRNWVLSSRKKAGDKTKLYLIDWEEKIDDAA